MIIQILNNNEPFCLVDVFDDKKDEFEDALANALDHDDGESELLEIVIDTAECFGNGRAFFEEINI